jgi:CBS domain-containing protein
MLVSQILKSKPTHDLLWVRPSDAVTEAVKMMSENRVGTVIVSKDGQSLDGILSERDVVRELGRQDASILAKPVSDLMTAKLVTCTESDSSESVLERMTQGRFRHMPVMNDGEILGLISIGDVVKAQLAELAMEKDALEGMIMGR